MKILQVIPYFLPAYAFGGPVEVASQFSRELFKRGHDVVVYTTDAKDPNSRLNVEPVRIVDGIKVHYMRNLTMMFVKKSKLFITPELVSKAKEEIKEFDVIHIHEYRSFQNIVVHHYAKKYGVPYILQAHGSLPRIMAKQKLKWIYDIFFGYKLLRDAKKVIALSQTEAEQYRDMGVPDEKIAIIPNGIDLSDYAGLPSKGEFKKKFNIPWEKKIILYVGRIHRTKGIDFLLKAFAYLIKKMKFKDALLVVVGPDDGYLHEVKSLSAFLGVSNSVLFTGLISNKDKISAYVDSSICCYLNPNEPFGLVSLEAAVSKLLVVVSEGTPMSEIVKRSGFGFSITYGDVLALVKTMEIVLKDEKLSNEMGKRGREYVFENFGWDTIIDKYEMLYGDIRACP